MKMMLEYIDPHPSGGVQITRMTRQQAIDWTREVYKDRTLTKTLTDDRILDNFIAINWAYWVEERV